MEEYDKMMKLVDYAKTLGINIEDWKISKKPFGYSQGGAYMHHDILTTINMKAKFFLVVEKPRHHAMLLHIGNFNG